MKLDRNTVNSIGWQELKPRTPYYFFVPKDYSLHEEYEEYGPVEYFRNMFISSWKNTLKLIKERRKQA